MSLRLRRSPGRGSAQEHRLQVDLFGAELGDEQAALGECA
jgi:hypothetical protein